MRKHYKLQTPYVNPTPQRRALGVKRQNINSKRSQWVHATRERGISCCSSGPSGVVNQPAGWPSGCTAGSKWLQLKHAVSISFWRLCDISTRRLRSVSALLICILWPSIKRQVSLNCLLKYYLDENSLHEDETLPPQLTLSGSVGHYELCAT